MYKVLGKVVMEVVRISADNSRLAA